MPESARRRSAIQGLFHALAIGLFPMGGPAAAQVPATDPISDYIHAIDLIEADKAGAEYMAKLGYDSQQMLEMLSIMKDYESLMKRRAKSRGTSKQTYHGIFSTHPRNDSRLRTVVSKAKDLKSAIGRDKGAATYREFTEGLIWGENFVAKQAQSERYSNMQLRVRLDFPDRWQQTINIDSYLAMGQPENKSASLSLQIMPRTAQGPEEYLYNHLGVSQLQNGQVINPAGLKGFTGILSGDSGKTHTRIAVIYYKMNAYLLMGEVEDRSEFSNLDKLSVISIQTFRPISNREIAGQRPKRVHYIQADKTTTFESLAKKLKLSTEDRDNLRLINGFYPAGEPKVGQWIKIFKQ